MLQRLKISSRLMLDFGVFTLGVAGLTALSGYSAAITAQSLDRLGQQTGLERLEHSLEDRVQEGERAVWLALATGDPAQQAKANTAWDAASHLLDELRAAAGNPEQARPLDALQARLAELVALAATATTPQGAAAPGDKAAAGGAMSAVAARFAETAGAWAADHRAGADAAISEAQRRLGRFLRMALGFGAASVLAGLGLTALLTRTISRPIEAVTAAMRSLAAGDVATPLPILAIGNEFGAMAAALQQFREHELENRRLVEEHAQRRDATTEARRAALRQMADTIERETGLAVEQVRKLTLEITQISHAMADDAGRTGLTASEAAVAASQSLAAARIVAAAAAQLTESVGEITRQVGQCHELSQRAVAVAADARGRIETLTQQAGQIGDIARSIGAVAGRARRLAINATIEAARAGEAGKRFAVVADEVKQLANHTTQSTEEITRQIDAIATATRLASEAVERVVASVGDINTIGSTVADATVRQGGVAAQIAQSVVETATAANQVSQRAEQVRLTASETDRRAGTVRAVAQSLETAVMGLRTSINRLVRTSSEDVNRRKHQRVPVDLPAQLFLPDRPAMDVRLGDISLGGAMLRGVGEVVPGTRARLVFSGIDVEATFRSTKGPLVSGVSFDPDGAMQEQLAALIGRVAPQTIAA